MMTMHAMATLGIPVSHHGTCMGVEQRLSCLHTGGHCMLGFRPTAPLKKPEQGITTLHGLNGKYATIRSRIQPA